MAAQPAPLLAAAAADVLRKHAPFDAMAEADLIRLAGKLKVRYFDQGSVILSPANGVVRSLFIVQRGAVEAEEAEARSLHSVVASFAEGECFPIGALLGGRATTLNYKAAQDTFCYTLEEAEFRGLVASSPPFQAFCTGRLAALLAASARGTREAYASRAAEEMTMSAPLRKAVRHTPVTMPDSASVRDVLEAMKSRRIGSIVLVGSDARPTGIFTQTDVLNRVALSGKPLERPISQVMTAHPAALTADSPLSAAAELMARKGFRHLLVMDGGALIGVISERDLFGLQRLSMQGLRKDIAKAETIEELAHAAREVRSLGAAMLGQGVAAEQLTQFLSALNDGVAERAITLALRVDDVSDSGFCWIGLGSEGRGEQTLATDQDNAIIFPEREGTEREATRKRLLAFADRVNVMLDQCGYPLCKGNIMARNPDWCLSLAEWKHRFDDWIRNSDPQALLNSSIFFDFRALHGDGELVDTLRQFLLASVKGRPVFLRQMAANAIQVRPPIGFFGGIVVDRGERGTVDLKKQAARVFVDCARILSLAAGVGGVSTVERLRLVAPVLQMGDDEVGSAIDSFHFIQMLRLRRQDALEREGGGSGDEPNRVDPEDLSPLDRRILREALRHARKLQNRVALDYQL